MLIGGSYSPFLQVLVSLSVELRPPVHVYTMDLPCWTFWFTAGATVVLSTAVTVHSTKRNYVFVLTQTSYFIKTSSTIRLSASSIIRSDLSET